jgi:hypothetical protein
VPGWSIAAVAGVGAAAAVGLVVAGLAHRPAVTGAALAVGLVALLIGPAIASGDLVATSRSPFDIPFEDDGVREQLQVLPARALDEGEAGIDVRRKLRQNATYLFATQSAIIAATPIYSSGEEVLPIGGFSGRTPTPTVRQLTDDVVGGALHFVLLPPVQPGDDDRLQWIRTNCAALPPTADTTNLAASTHTAVLTVYFCGKT